MNDPGSAARQSADVKQVQANVVEIRRAMRRSQAFFIDFFLHDELIFPTPPFHYDLFNLMTSTAVQYCAFAVPRDHAKTTFAKLALAWYLLFENFSFPVYLSNIIGNAIPSVNDIAAFFDTDNFVTVFGETKWLTRQDGIGFYRFIIQVPDKDDDTKLRPKLCILKALGSGGSVRGLNVNHKRPDLAIVDDLEDIENIATEELYKKLKSWFYRTFLKCLNKFDHKVIQIGNMISSTCLLREHCESEYWFSRVYGSLLEDGSPLWPDAWPVEKLRKDFQMYVRAGQMDAWFAEMMNMPIGSGSGLITAAEIFYAPEVFPEHVQYGFITIDPAISRQTWANDCAIVVHVWTGEYWQIAEAEGERGIDPVALFHRVMLLCAKWGINVVGIESVAYQAAIKPVFEYMCEIHGVIGMTFVNLLYAARKSQRLYGWAGMIKSRQYALTMGDMTFTMQLLEYNPAEENKNKDDFIDAAAYGPAMIDGWLPEIMQTFSPLPPAVGRNSYQIEQQIAQNINRGV